MKLTKREEEVLSLMARNKTNLEIAQSLGISLKTVKSHTHSIFIKLGVTSRIGAVLAYLKER